MATSYSGPLAGGARPPAPPPAAWRRRTSVARPGAIRLGRLALLGTAALLGVLAGLIPHYAGRARSAARLLLGLLTVDLAAGSPCSPCSPSSTRWRWRERPDFLKLAGAVLAVVSGSRRCAPPGGKRLLPRRASVGRPSRCCCSSCGRRPAALGRASGHGRPRRYGCRRTCSSSSSSSRRCGRAVTRCHPGGLRLGAAISAGVAWTNPSSAMVAGDGRPAPPAVEATPRAGACSSPAWR